VYSLAVLLYELLAGAHPSGASGGSPAALLRAIVDTEPLRLSESISAAQTPSASRAGERAGNRATTPEGLKHLLRGDLDTIVSKALKKNPAERYPSVTGLADDLRRYLDHQPISARPDTWTYRSAKFVRRNRVPVALASLTFVVMVAGLAGTITQARRATRHAAAANQQRDFALRQLSRAEAINDLNIFVLSDAAPSGKPFTVGELLARAETIAERQHGETDENRVELLVALGRQYQVQDEDGNARRLLTKAFEIAQKLPDSALRAKAACAYGSAIAGAGEFERAEGLVRTALQDLPAEAASAVDRIFCLMRGSEIAREGNDPETGIARIQEAQRLLEQLPIRSAVWDLRLSMALAESYRMNNRDRDASAAFAVAAEKLSALGRDNTQAAGTLLNNWALAVLYLGQPLEAERLFRKAIDISSADAAQAAVSPMLLTNYARTLLELNRVPEARQYAERAEAGARRVANEMALNYALNTEVYIYRDHAEPARAARALAELEERWTRMLPPGHIAFAAIASHHARLAQLRGDLAAAESAADRAVKIAEAREDSALSGYLFRRAELKRQIRKYDDARADATRALEIELKVVDPSAPSSRLGRFTLGLARILHDTGQSDEAQKHFATALQHLRATLGPEHPDTITASQFAERPTNR
jgi:serine/threonine-protein kinase